MTRTNEDGARLAAKAACSVVVVHEDAVARERAVSFCDQLVSRFWARSEFEVSWWSFALLEQAMAAKTAADKAAEADLIVFAATPEGDFPGPVKAWVETWLGQRGDREGVLVCLMAPAGHPDDREGWRHQYLRNAAHRGAMDYLTHLPQAMSRSMPDSLDSYTKRAVQVTSLLDDILRQPAPPPPSLP